MNISSKQRSNNGKKGKIYSFRLKDGVVIGSIFAMGVVGAFKSDKNLPMRNEPTDNALIENAVLAVDANYHGTAVTVLNVKEAYRLAKYNVDTVIIDTAYLKKKYRVFGNYNAVVKALTIHHFKLDTIGMSKKRIKREQAFAKRHNSPKSIYSILVHEGTHEINDKEGMKAFGISSYHMAKICIHDEVTANIAQLLEMRNTYLKTNDINAIEPQFAFYRDALKNNSIQPDISKIPDEKELSLIVNGMIAYWCKTNQTYYEKTHIRLTADWVKRAFLHDLKDKALHSNLGKRQQAEYIKRLSKAYSFKLTLVDQKENEKTAVIDFSRFIKKDVEISDNFKEHLEKLENRSLAKAYEDYKETAKKDKKTKYWMSKKNQKLDKDYSFIKERNLTDKAVLLERSPQGKLVIKNKTR